MRIPEISRHATQSSNFKVQYNWRNWCPDLYTRSISKIRVLLIKLPNSPDKYNVQSIIRYYSSFTIVDQFCLSDTFKEKLLKIITNTESSKAPGVDRLSVRFSKYGANMLAKPISALCNNSVSQGVFAKSWKLAKLKPFLKNEKKLIFPTTGQSHRFH